MKKITLCYRIYEKREFTIPEGKWQKFFAVWNKDEEELTDDEYEILTQLSLADFIREQTNQDIDEDNIDVWDYE